MLIGLITFLDVTGNGILNNVQAYILDRPAVAGCEVVISKMKREVEQSHPWCTLGSLPMYPHSPGVVTLSVFRRILENEYVAL